MEVTNAKRKFAHQIVAAAAFLSERMTSTERDNSQGKVAVDGRGDKCVADWLAALGQESLTKRLEWDGFQAGDNRWFDDDSGQQIEQIPDWVDVLWMVSKSGSANTAGNDLAFSSYTRGIPYAPWLSPIVTTGCEILEQRLSSLTPEIKFSLWHSTRSDLLRSLTTQLSRICRYALAAVDSRSGFHGDALVRLLGFSDDRTSASTPKSNGVDFIDFWLEFPVLGRLVGSTVLLWVESTAEFLTRLDSDSVGIDMHFADIGMASGIASIQTALSDRHHGGRSVYILDFNSGGKLVYKPKPMAMEEAFGEFLTWCNARVPGPHLYAPKVMDRGGYGWCEFVHQAPCKDEMESRLFFERTGMLLCLFYVLHTTDCHYENLVARGDQPVLIDAETLISPDPQPIDDSILFVGMSSNANIALFDSILRTGMLPRWTITDAGKTVLDVSGLGSDINDSTESPIGHNRAMLGDRVLSAADHQNELIEGLTKMYRMLVQHRQALLSTDGPLAAMFEAPGRFIFRNTRLYGQLLDQSVHPDTLRSGFDFSVHFEKLARAFLPTTARPLQWPLFSDEMHSLLRLDIPHFGIRASSRAITLANGVEIPNALKMSGIEAVNKTIERLSETDLERQIGILKGSFLASRTRIDDGMRVAVGSTVQESAELDSARLLLESKRIGDDIAAHALQSDSDGAEWVGLCFLSDADRFQLDVLGDDLYEGCSGIAIFLAALHNVSGDTSYRDLSQASLARLRRLGDLNIEAGEWVARSFGLGGGVGVGSWIYSLATVGKLLGDGSLIDAAIRMSRWFTEGVVSRDNKLDAMSGAAGALLGLLKLYDVSHADEVLVAARRCGEHLLRKQHIAGTTIGAWTTVSPLPLTGLSHGAAGIALAMARLYSKTAEGKFFDSSVAAIAFENAHYLEGAENWPDFRDTEIGTSQAHTVRWCHGAAGIVLARVGCQKAGIPQLEDDIERGLKAVKRRYIQDEDHICCGNLGRIETLLVSGQFNKRDELFGLAIEGMATVLSRAKQRGHFQLFHGLRNVPNHGFFRGSAGIGYGMLRLIDPALVSVASWE